MADETNRRREDLEPVDNEKKLHINNVLVPELDDTILRIAKMRKKQPIQCQIRAQRASVHTVKYYSQFSVECEKGDWDVSKSSIQQGVLQYGSVDVSMAQNLSALSKALRDCLTERKEVLKEKEELEKFINESENSQKILLPKLKPIPFSHSMLSYIEA